MPHPLAGQPAPASLLIDPAHLINLYFREKPSVENPAQRVAFGTSGHRGTSLDGSFTESHILAITQAICEYRAGQGTGGPVFIGKDTHALSSPAQVTALEVLSANGVTAICQAGDGATPTPSISHSILNHNRGVQPSSRADGIVITPSHNPPKDGGFKYNPPHGGPAETAVTAWIERRANELLADGNRDVRRTVPKAVQSDLISPYVDELASILDLDAVRAAGVKIGVDPLGGASFAYWPVVAERYNLDLTVVNQKLDPAFSFMTLDHDGVIRMDCSSPYAMASLVSLKDSFDVAFGNDPDADRHGIVTRSAGLLNPNHYLAVAIAYLLDHREGWPVDAAVGKTVVSSSIIDRVVESRGRKLSEVPVGFKWFAPGLADGSFCFGGEESAGASFLRKDGSVWSTDKDGLILGLLAAEITAVTGRNPGEHYQSLTREFGAPAYVRVDTPCTAEAKAGFAKLTPQAFESRTIGGEPVTGVLTNAPGNGQPIGGVKVTTKSAWFAARPSGTENIYKLYIESNLGAKHLEQLTSEATEALSTALRGS